MEGELWAERRVAPSRKIGKKKPERSNVRESVSKHEGGTESSKQRTSI
jgi:hypothetical protein